MLKVVIYGTLIYKSSILYLNFFQNAVIELWHQYNTQWWTFSHGTGCTATGILPRNSSTRYPHIGNCTTTRHPPSSPGDPEVSVPSEAYIYHVILILVYIFDTTTQQNKSINDRSFKVSQIKFFYVNQKLTFPLGCFGQRKQT